MNQTLKEILHEITSVGFEAYLVGGYPRDYYLKIETNDYDIATSATPEELKNIFPCANYQDSEYGRISLERNNIFVEITTFRIEEQYTDNRHPEKIKYAKSIAEDIQRRDFIINTLYMDENENIIDLLGAKKDIDEKVIRSVGDSKQKMEEDALRMLRAIRFASTLKFKINEELKEAIHLYKQSIKNLSYFRKKEELNRIFVSEFSESGISLLQEFNLQKELEIDGLENLNTNTSLLGIWAQLKFSSKYEFSHNEKKGIKKIRELLSLDLLEPLTLYNYGHYYCGIAAEIKNESKNKILEAYHSLPIHHRNEIAITSKELMTIVDKEMLSEVYEDLEKQILNGQLDNLKLFIKKYVMQKYHGRKG